jgi:hypothetical protein
MEAALFQQEQQLHMSTACMLLPHPAFSATTDALAFALQNVHFQ